MPAPDFEPTPTFAEIARSWGWIGCVGFGGPPAHIALFRELCVERRAWLTNEQFERALAAVNLLPGPASTQLSIYCAWRLQGRRGALLGGLCFILPGLLIILALSVLFLGGSPPRWVRGAGMGAGAAVAAVAVSAGLGVAAPIWTRTAVQGHRRLLLYALAGGVAAGEYPLDIYARWFRQFLTFIVPIGCVSYYPVLAILHRPDPWGTPTWVLLPSVGQDWRWVRGREDSPWYPSVRLFRQAAPGDWREVVDRVRAALSGEGLG